MKSEDGNKDANSEKNMPKFITLKMKVFNVYLK